MLRQFSPSANYPWLTKMRYLILLRSFIWLSTDYLRCFYIVKCHIINMTFSNKKKKWHSVTWHNVILFSLNLSTWRLLSISLEFAAGDSHPDRVKALQSNSPAFLTLLWYILGLLSTACSIIRFKVWLLWICPRLCRRSLPERLWLHQAWQKSLEI